MTPAKLAVIGQALFGPQWQSPLARALGVSVRTINYWLTPETRAGMKIPPRPIPADRQAQLLGMLYEHADRATALAKSVKLPATEKPKGK